MGRPRGQGRGGTTLPQALTYLSGMSLKSSMPPGVPSDPDIPPGTLGFFEGCYRSELFSALEQILKRKHGPATNVMFLRGQIIFNRCRRKHPHRGDGVNCGARM